MASFIEDGTLEEWTLVDAEAGQVEELEASRKKTPIPIQHVDTTVTTAPKLANYTGDAGQAFKMALAARTKQGETLIGKSIGRVDLPEEI